jgi:hypothetical protein
LLDSKKVTNEKPRKSAVIWTALGAVGRLNGGQE